MPRRRRNKSTEEKKPRLLFTESPVNIVHSIPSPALASDHPATADVVSVDDANATWVSPHFEGAQSSNDHPKRKRSSRHLSGMSLSRTTRTRAGRLSVNTTPGKGHGHGQQRQAAMYKSLQFVEEDPQVEENPSSPEDITYDDVPQGSMKPQPSHSPQESPCFPKSKRLTAKKAKQKKKVLTAVLNLTFSDSDNETSDNIKQNKIRRDPKQDNDCSKSKEDLKNNNTTHDNSMSNSKTNGDLCELGAEDPHEKTSLESMLNTTKQLTRHKNRQNYLGSGPAACKDPIRTSPSPMDTTGVRPVSSRKGKPPTRRLFRPGCPQVNSTDDTSNSDTDKENARRGGRDMKGKRLYPGNPNANPQPVASSRPDASIRYQTPPNQKVFDSPNSPLVSLKNSPSHSGSQRNTPCRRSLRIKHLQERAALFFNAPKQSSEDECFNGRPPLVYDTPEEDYGLSVRLRRIKYAKLHKLEFL